MSVNFKQLIVIFLIMFLGIIIGVLLLWPTQYYELASRGVLVNANVTRKDAENHRFIYYEYVVEDKTFSGIGNAGRGNPDFENIGVGQGLIAYYDPKNPSTSCLGYAKTHFQVNMAGIFFVAIVLPVVVILGLRRKGYLKGAKGLN